jgi:hypothetical protein
LVVGEETLEELPRPALVSGSDLHVARSSLQENG